MWTTSRRDGRPRDAGGSSRRTAIPWPVWLAVVLAVAVRVGLITAYFGWDRPLGQDGADYHALAANIVAGHGYAVFPGQPSAWRPPGYPAYLSAVYAVTGGSHAVVRGTHCLLGGALAFLMFLLGRALADHRVGVGAALVAAIYPLFAAMVGFLYTESLYLPGVVAVALVFLWLREAPCGTRALVLGAAAGLSALIRPNLLILPVLGGAALWAGGLPLRRASALTAAMVAGAALVVAPWTARNWAVLGELVPISTNGGITLFIGNNHRATGGGGVEWAVVGHPPEEAEREYALLGLECPSGSYPSGIDFWPDLSEVENDRRYRELALTWMRQHPREAAALVPRKLAKFWSWRITSSRDYTRRYAWLSLCSYGVMLPFAILGFVLSLRNWRRWSVVYAMAVPYILSACVFYGSARLRLPVDCFLIILAVFAVVQLQDWRARRGRGARPAPDET